MEKDVKYIALEQFVEQLIISIPEKMRLVIKGFIPRVLSGMVCKTEHELPERMGYAYVILENTTAALEGTDRFRLYAMAECPVCHEITHIRERVGDGDIDLGFAEYVFSAGNSKDGAETSRLILPRKVGSMTH